MLRVTCRECGCTIANIPGGEDREKLGLCGGCNTKIGKELLKPDPRFHRGAKERKSA